MVDPLGKKFDYLWRIPELRGTISTISRSTSSCSFLVWGENSECWTVQVPGFTVRRKAPIPEPVEHSGELFQRTAATSPEGTTAQVVVRRSQNAGSTSYETYLQIDGAAGKRFESLLSQEEATLLKPILTAGWLFAPLRTRDGCLVEILKRDTAVRQSRCTFPGAGNLSLRVSDSLLAIGDDLGRFVLINLESGLVLREFRV
jgi:hypothetical protein